MELRVHPASHDAELPVLSPRKYLHSNSILVIGRMFVYEGGAFAVIITAASSSGLNQIYFPWPPSS